MSFGRYMREPRKANREFLTSHKNSTRQAIGTFGMRRLRGGLADTVVCRLAIAGMRCMLGSECFELPSTGSCPFRDEELQHDYVVAAEGAGGPTRPGQPCFPGQPPPPGAPGGEGGTPAPIEAVCPPAP